MEQAIGIKDLSFGYDGQTVLEDINLEISQGDFVAFIGPNGTGKSTLMKLMVGQLEADQGQLKVLKKSVSDFDDWDKIGFISQKVRDFNKSFPATVKEIVGANLYQQMGFFKILSPDLVKKVDAALEKVDMLEYKERQLGSLSGGQQQRVFIARVLVTEPEIIFLDEPLVGVDAKNQEDFYRLLEGLNQSSGITIIMISHNVNLVSKKANKIVCFEDGQIYTHTSEEFEPHLHSGRTN